MKVVTEGNAHVIVSQAVISMVNRFEEYRESTIFKLPKHQLTKFHSWKVPRIGMEEYVQRIHRYVKCSSGCYTIALIYIDRAVQRSRCFFPTKFNIHRYLSDQPLVSSWLVLYWP
eukprot:TRINITY_DN4911_c0_g1_i13.p1 TRINITY_DN4911_c0_g1~~TRINITY_DN4911_c0_g1_i13.p1  ORF type:complete len:115 (+),score=1.23 TRINITY_DN4911_c0_g1_i13:178-522(+)